MPRLSSHWSNLLLASSLIPKVIPFLAKIISLDNSHRSRQRRSFTLNKMYAVSKLNKQHEQTWINLQKRLNSVQFPYQKLFRNQDVHKFVKNKAVSVGSCEGFFIPSLMTTTAFILACNKARVDTTTHKQPLNIFTIFVGYPGTGKYYFRLFTSLFDTSVFRARTQQGRKKFTQKALLLDMFFAIQTRFGCTHRKIELFFKQYVVCCVLSCKL